ncbi:alpha/beta fold hydrolase [Herbiconiux daphne]|uniref:Alpha/beta fold hydrolase n=1 Tax=Herbiconiux daphne TaxID=2970914 RepID=A0ABT2GYG0_9MICO|nr:alpha/beta fold hydrolase [Herbiconiux daphne]MCS5732994.1 alpha/beta fold hydrolase [Herbiconiux daphne]
MDTAAADVECGYREEVDFATNPADGTRIAYRAIGEGSPLVLVHGTALSQAIWRGFGYLREFTRDHRVITLDLRGHGRSDKPHSAGSYAMHLFAADVLAVLDALEIEAAHYAGYSLGGRVGFSLAAAHPGRLRSFVSLAGAPGTGGGAFDRVFFPGSLQALESGGMAGFLEGWERASGAPLDPITRGAFAANDAAALAAYMRETERDERVPDAALAALPMPVLLAAGSRDPERLRAAHHVRGLLPTAELAVIEGATHADTPRHPEALALTRAFLDRLAP